VSSVTDIDAAGHRERWYRLGLHSSRTLVDAFERGALDFGDVSMTFVTADGETDVTVRELHCTARAVAAGMQRRGVRPGDAVAVQLTNRLECAVIYEAVLLCGAVLVPIVHIYGSREVGFILAESGARMFVMLAGWRSTSYLDRIPEYAGLTALEDIVVVDATDRVRGCLPWRHLVADVDAYVRPDVSSDEVCVLLYTSGTVSVPKGVQHTHNSILAEQMSHPRLMAGEPNDVQLVTFPPGHVAGLNSMLRPLLSGTRSVFMDQWEPAGAADLISQHSVTSTSGAPVHLAALLDVADVEAKLSTLREFLTGAANVAEELVSRAASVGVAAYRCYGMTEHPTVTSARPGDALSARMGTDGLPLPGCAVRISDEHGDSVPVGIDGEVVVQGPDQFVGYRDPGLNDGAFTRDGWFRTGDLGHLDSDGRLTITDRVKDVIIRGGETISSGQVEEVLEAHPAIAEAAAVAAPHERYGEVVAAVIVLRGGARLDLDDVRRHFATSGLARQKAPERLVLVDALPRTALGKVRKAELRRAHFG
jgi:acyl-CoA synthetase (AMP-forming)/AMP-acid ligase II